MTNEEINLAVAEKIGFTCNCDCHDNPPARICDCGYTGLCKFRIPAFCTSISEAWKIVEWISKKYDPNGPLEETKHSDGRYRYVGNGFRLEYHTEDSMEKWVCTLPEIVCAPPYEEININIQAISDTAPMAICLAFLKMGGVDNGNK